MIPLTTNQRAYLRREAHSLKPVVQLGKQGLTPALVTAVDTALTAHELIKVKFGEFKDEKTALADEIAAATGAVLVAVIGNIAILYREHPERDKRRIVLPAPGARNAI